MQTALDKEKLFQQQEAEQQQQQQQLQKAPRRRPQAAPRMRHNQSPQNTQVRFPTTPAPIIRSSREPLPTDKRDTPNTQKTLPQFGFKSTSPQPQGDSTGEHPDSFRTRSDRRGNRPGHSPPAEVGDADVRLPGQLPELGAHTGEDDSSACPRRARTFRRVRSEARRSAVTPTVTARRVSIGRQ
jgi:hypothetical protein